ncbi:MAG TPA: DUF1236 domain-containing protein [Candidatus Binataceae bacterium]|jgi:hypothetical protein
MKVRSTAAALLLCASTIPALAEAGSGLPFHIGESLNLTPAQRAAIVKAVEADKIQTTSTPQFAPVVGAEAPASIPLHLLPEAAIAVVPSGDRYQYTLLANDVVIVEPTTMRIVEVIKR